MWIASVEGFFSIVKVRDKADRYFVRARERRDLLNLRRLLREDGMQDASTKIHHTPDSDYPFRLVVSSGVVRIILDSLADGIDYPNFKSAVGLRKDQENKPRLYHRVWDAMAELGCGLWRGNARRLAEKDVLARPLWPYGDARDDR